MTRTRSPSEPPPTAPSSPPPAPATRHNAAAAVDVVTVNDRNFLRLRRFVLLLLERVPARQVERCIAAAVDETDAGLPYGTEPLDRFAAELALQLQPPAQDDRETLFAYQDGNRQAIASLGTVRAAFDAVFNSGGEDREPIR